MEKAVGKKTKLSQFFSRFFRLSCPLWTQFSQLLKGQFGKLLCPPHREFPEVFETPPTFISSLFQRGVIAKNQERAFFLGHPVCETTIQEPLSHPYVTYLQTYTIQIFLQVLQVLLLVG